MSTTLTIEETVHFGRSGKGGARELRAGPAPAMPELGRVPRVARLMALALRFEKLLREGVVADFSELARLGHVTPARISQVMSLIHLAPDIQEAILFLPRTETGRDPIILRDLLPIAATVEWKKQRKMWAELIGRMRAVQDE
jgi:hypothetical protein